jgi:hypothetical protein
MRPLPCVSAALLVVGLGLFWFTQNNTAPHPDLSGKENGSSRRDEPRSTPTPARAQVSTSAIPAPYADITPAAAPTASTLGSTRSPFVYRAVPFLSPEEVSFQQSLRPRAVPPKEPLSVPPGLSLRLQVKLADAFYARATPDGRLLVDASSSSDALSFARAAENYGLMFRRVHTVSDEAMQALEHRAAVNTLTAQPDLGGLVEAVVPDATRERVIAIAQALHSLLEVEYVELESLDRPPPPPAADIAPTTPSLTSYQTYRAAANGINVDYVWNTFGIRGHPSLRLTNCEYSWNGTHEDLAGLIQNQPGLVSMYTGFGDDHGTAVLGILFAGNNGYGMTGSVPDCSAWFFPEYSTLSSGFQSRAACVTAAIASSSTGDIVMLEMQTRSASSRVYVPAEYELSVFYAVKTGTAAGVIVTAAAGNGAANLDDAPYDAYRARGDSGAIIVGAGTTARARQSFSTYGARVNVQGWGSGVATTGYGSLVTYDGDSNQKYSSDFSGTSSATPIVTSAVALLQSVAIEICQKRLGPAELRSLLATSGRSQTGDISKPIGRLPDLQAAVAALLLAHPPTFTTLRSWSLYHFGTPTPALNADPDADGLSSLLEYTLGSNPTSNNSADNSARQPRLTFQPGVGNGALVFEFKNPATRIGAVWKVQSNSTLASDGWQDLPIGTNGVTGTRTGDVYQVKIPTSANPGTLFLRLQVAAP